MCLCVGVLIRERGRYIETITKGGILQGPTVSRDVGGVDVASDNP